MKGLRYFWRQHLAVAAGCAVASAVLAGALLVGDSVRGSLLQLTLNRLGDVNHALVSNGFFRTQLADSLAEDSGGTLAPMVALQGSARHGDSGARASGVAVLGVDERFLSLYAGDLKPAAWSFGDLDAPLPPVILGETLATELGAVVGDAVLLSIPRVADVPRASLLGRRESGDLLRTLRTTVSAVVPDRGAGGFSLSPHQGSVKNLFLPLARLQEAIGRPTQVNSLLAAEGPVQGEDSLEDSLRGHLRLEDMGLFLRRPSSAVSLESKQLVLQDATVEAVESFAASHGAQSQRILTYLANQTRVGDRSMPYSSVAALPGEAFQEMKLESGELATPPAEDEILLNAWAAEDLGAQIGDEVRLEYFVVGDQERLRTQEATLRVSGVVAMAGLGADPQLTPELPGMHDAEDISAWDPPFPVDLSLIRDKDEEYWDDYRAAPKAFVSLATGQNLWRSRFGGVTALRMVPGDGNLEGLAQALKQELPAALPLEAFTMAFQPVRREGVEAAQGATDFGGLFLAFSWFLIVAAALLVALLFSLGVEQRVREIGLLRAVGFPELKVRRRFLAEGALVAAVGSLVGLVGAVAYAALLMAGLRTWWLPAVGSRQLNLHVTGTSLVTGFLIALGITLLAIFITLRRLRKVSAPALLAGEVRPQVALGKALKKARRPLIVALVAAALAIAFTLAALRAGAGSAALAFGAGASVLVAGLGAFAWSCRRSRPATSPGSLDFRAMASRNAVRNPGRSLLSLSLVACACFVLVLTGLNRRPSGEDVFDLHSGAGGFGLLASSDIPLFQDLGNSDGRFELGLGGESEELLQGAEVFALRTLQGEDASCLNLYRVEQPRVLGVPDALVQRGAFHFQQAAREVDNPWTLLQEDLGRDPESGARILPAVADFETAQWILKKKLGDDLEYVDEGGEPVRLRLVATLHASIFQSEVLVSEENLVRHFPSLEGYSTFLLDAPAASLAPLGTALENDLKDYGFDAGTTAAKLASFKAVQNTYLSTFQTLGGLGLLLGSLGLAVVLLRNVLERRGELAVLQAFGFRPRRLRSLVLLENLWLLLRGLALGTVAAVVASAPYLRDSLGSVPLAPIFGILLLVFVVGGLACWWATTRAVGPDLVAGLRTL